MAANIPFMVKEARHYSGREAKAPSSVNSLGPVTCMDSGIEVVEERLNSFTSQLESECAILERIVYKNKNQHRRYYLMLFQSSTWFLLSQKEQSVKLIQAGIEVFREYYPTNEEFVALECVWETDKFVLLERIKKMKMKNQDGDPREDVSLGTATIQYQNIEALLVDGHAPEFRRESNSDQ